MKILVCGDRDWKDRRLIELTLFELKLPAFQITIVEGGARGADTIARQIAIKHGIFVIEVKADWATYGKAAGSIRNQKMLDDHHPDYVLAFHDDIANSKGTKDMIERAIVAGIPYRLITH